MCNETGGTLHYSRLAEGFPAAGPLAREPRSADVEVPAPDLGCLSLGSFRGVSKTTALLSIRALGGCPQQTPRSVLLGRVAKLAVGDRADEARPCGTGPHGAGRGAVDPRKAGAALL